PLIVHGRMLGAILAVRARPAARFESRSLELFENMAHQVAMAIGTVELYRAQEDQAQRSAALARVGRELITSLSEPMLLERLCRLATEILECDVSHTLLWDPAQQAYAVVAGYGDPPESWESARLLTLPRALIGRMIAQLQRDDLVEVEVGKPQDLLPD